MHFTRRRAALVMSVLLTLVAALLVAADCRMPTSEHGECVLVSERWFCQGGGAEDDGGPTPVPTATPTATPLPSGTAWETLGGNYAADTPCLDGPDDPIGTILIMASADAPSADQFGQ